jgi:hypothetical protein
MTALSLRGPQWACIFLLGFVAARATAAPTTRPAEHPSRFETPEAIERVTKYYLDMYAKHVEAPNPLARAFVVISLAQLDDDRATKLIVDLMKKDPVPVVRVYAWEALHARLNRLDPEQTLDWRKAGHEFAEKGWLYGDLRVGLVGIMRMEGPTRRNKQLFGRLFDQTNSLNPGDMRTLNAMARLIDHWRSPDIIRALIAGMGDHNTAWRAEYILRHIRMKEGLPSSDKWMRKLGSRKAWPITQQHWAQWYKQNPPEEIDPGASAYEGRTDLMPAGEKITDTRDPKWRKDLELGKFKLKQLDVGFVIDSTGSMGPCIRWIQRDVVRMMRAFELISKEPRIGVTLYRDHGDAYLVKSIPLSGQAEVLARRLKRVGAKGGGDIPESVFSGMYEHAIKNRWSTGDATKIIILMGDAPPHKKELDEIDKLIELGVDKGFLFYAVKIKSHYVYRKKHPNYDPNLEGFDRIAERGKGRSFWVDFHAIRRRARRRGYAVPRPEDSPDRVIFREVLKAAIAGGYEDRVNAFVNVLEQYVERTYPEDRDVVYPPRKKGPGKPRKPPKDPQAH